MKHRDPPGSLDGPRQVFVMRRKRVSLTNREILPCFLSVSLEERDTSIQEGETKILLEMQKNTARTVMLTLEGMGLLFVEAVINSSLAVLKDTVNGAVGFVLV